MAVQRMSHEEFARFVLRISADKETLTKRFARGYTAVEEAVRYKVPISAFRDACRATGVELPRAGGSRGSIKPLVAALLIVIERLASNLGVDYSEIKPFLQEKGDANGTSES